MSCHYYKLDVLNDVIFKMEGVYNMINQQKTSSQTQRYKYDPNTKPSTYALLPASIGTHVIVTMLGENLFFLSGKICFTPSNNLLCLFFKETGRCPAHSLRRSSKTELHTGRSARSDWAAEPTHNQRDSKAAARSRLSKRPQD
jgi:hypothetical protein